MIDVSKQVKTNISRNIVLNIVGEEDLVIPSKGTFKKRKVED